MIQQSESGLKNLEKSNVDFLVTSYITEALSIVGDSSCVFYSLLDLYLSFNIQVMPCIDFRMGSGIVSLCNIK